MSSISYCSLSRFSFSYFLFFFYLSTPPRSLPSFPTRRSSDLLFLRLLGLTYLIAFVSLWTQIDGLVGHNGILPAADYLEAIRQRVGPERYWWLPTICWFSASDSFLHFLCGSGVVLSLLLLIGVAPTLALILLW